MAIKRLFFILFTILLFGIYSCKENPRNYNSNLLGPDQVDLITVDSFSGSFPQSSTSFKTVIKTGASFMMLVGKYNNQVASTLLKFNYYLPDSVKNDILNSNASITDAWVELTRVYVFGDSNGTFQFGAYKITSPWSSIGFTADSLENGAQFTYDATDIATQKNVTDSLTSFHLNTSYMTNELMNYGNGQATNGLYLNPISGNQTVFGYSGVLSSSYTTLPIIKIVVSKPGFYTDTLGMDTYEDVSVLTGGLPAISNPTDMIVQPMSVAQSRVAFDCSSIPSGAIINKATLILSLDIGSTVKGSSYNSNLSAFNIADSSGKSIDSTLSKITLTYSNDTFQGDVTSFVQKWVTKKQNQGILLTPEDGLFGMEIWAILGSNSSQQFNRPRLVITYTIKK
ncbi:MAG TPA: DNRLRE domain-containing protein [Ignavibacteriaceae bacterium]|nr:DNRLRE domain-containing protein [Ignavibacteriaceae bacterium]